jgi:hypothetical protein
LGRGSFLPIDRLHKNSYTLSYGFEDRSRLIENFKIPPEIVANSSIELANRLRHALDL